MIVILDTINEVLIRSEIVSIEKAAIPLKKDGWRFNWRQLSKDKKAGIYVLRTIDSPYRTEGAIKLRYESGMLIMDALELSPDNIGANKRYDYVAGCLIAFACKMSFSVSGEYKGFLTFVSKTSLVKWYINKYGAELAVGQRMFFKSRLIMKTQINEPTDGVLTERMDVGTEGFKEFQSILLEISRNSTEEEKRNIELQAIEYEMEDYANSYDKENKSPGEFLRLILKKLNIKQNKFAAYLGIKPSNLSKILSNERPINHELALIFGKLFDHDPMLWIRIQAKNQMDKLSIAEEDKYSGYSIKDLI